MSLFLCCDCGGTKTAAVICDSSGAILGRGFGGPSNFAYVSLDQFTLAISSTVIEALKACGSNDTDNVVLPPAKPLFAAAWFGVSGVDSPAAVQAITPELSKLLGIPVGSQLTVANDTHLLAAPLRMYPDVKSAIAVIAGTGSIAVSFRQEPNNEIVEQGRVGGWGWLLGDEGGGFHVGREAVRQVLAESDRASLKKNPTIDGPLVQALLKHFDVETIMQVLTAAHASDPSPSPDNTSASILAKRREQRLSSFTPHVFTCAFEHQDPLALKVLETCANILADNIAVLLGGPSQDTPNLVQAKDAILSFGGSLVGVEKYRKMVLDALVRKGHTFPHVHYVDDPAATGGKGLALSSAG